MMKQKILVIIPALNEEKSIGSVVDSVQYVVPQSTILVINDGSTDRTAEIAEQAGAVVLNLPYNLGIGGAVQSGYVYAKYHDYDIAIQIDGDGQHDPVYITKMIDKLNEFDLVIGSRFIENHGFKSTKMRRMGISFFSWLLRILTKQTFSDPTSGFRVANRKIIEYCARSYPKDYPEVEILLYLSKKKYSMGEFPVIMRERRFGKSSINLMKSIWYVLKVSLALCIGMSRRKL